MNLGLKRRKIEDQIEAQYHKVNFGEAKQAWVESAAFEDFIFSYFDLRRYYETSDDITLGLTPLHLYIRAQEALKTAANDRKISLDRREVAQRMTYELTYQVEAVMYELDQNRQEAERRYNAGLADDTGAIPVG